MARIISTQNLVRTTIRGNKSIPHSEAIVSVNGPTVKMILTFPGGFKTTARIDLDFNERAALLESAITQYEALARIKL